MLSIFLSWSMAKELLDIFKHYSKTTGITKWKGIPDKKTGKPKTVINPDGSSCLTYPLYEIKFTEWGRGITWYISFIETEKDKNGRQLRYAIFSVKLNPRLFWGDKNFITASNETHIDGIPSKYDSIIKEISNEIPPFSAYRLSRVDYCINFDLEELRLNIPVERMMELLERANDWGHFKERLVYNKRTHRKEPEENCFYLETRPLNINCYWKYADLIKNYPDTPNIEDSKNVIRFEPQFKSPKINKFRKVWHDPNLSDEENEWILIKNLLSDAMSEYVVFDYFDKVIRPGNYYTLETAISKCGSRQTLIDTLKLIAKKRGIHKAKKYLEEKLEQAVESRDIDAAHIASSNMDKFSYSLRELAKLGINPVCIPRDDWEVSSELGLMEAYKLVMEPVR